MDTLNQTPIRNKDLSDPVYDTFKHFCQTNGYKEIGWLFLIPLDKVRNRKERMRFTFPAQAPCT